MDSKLASQPEKNSIAKKQNAHVGVENNNESKQVYSLKKQSLSSYEKFLERDGTINTLVLVIVLLFIGFAYKLCCGKMARDRRIIKGRGTGSSVLTGGSKKALRNESLKSNHRNGIHVPQLKIQQQSDSQSSDQDW